jgi:ribonuclease HI/probable phosphoglycerate mutase
VDGASRGNPGPAAIGATIRDEKGNLLASISRPIGRTTNNQAEYRALIAALEKAAETDAPEVQIFLDSELVARQIKGRYRVKKAELRPLYQRAMGLLTRFSKYSVTSVPRTSNREADSLANRALR